MARRTLGIYLHIPFCLQKCNYCDFCSFGGQGRERQEAYVEELCRRIEKKAPEAEGCLVDTVYLGGGTPTLLCEAHMERLLWTVRESFSVSHDCEITCECNPATADLEKLTAIRR